MATQSLTKLFGPQRVATAGPESVVSLTLWPAALESKNEVVSEKASSLDKKGSFFGFVTFVEKYFSAKKYYFHPFFTDQI